MKRKFFRVSCILFVCLSMFSSDAFAQLFGGDDKKWERVLLEVKKLNTRIMEKVIPQIEQTRMEIKNLKAEISRVKSEINKVRSGNQNLAQQNKNLAQQNKNLAQQMENMTNVIPGIQASMDQGQAQTLLEVQSLGKRLSDLETRIQAGQARQAQAQKAGMDAIKQDISANLQSLKEGMVKDMQSLKEGMAKDMEQIAKLNQSSFQELIKNNQASLGSLEKQIEVNLNKQNTRMDKSIAVMTEMAKGGSKNSAVLASLQAGLVANNKALSEQNKKIIEILSKSLKEQETASTKMDALGGNQAKSDENVKFARQTMVALKGILDKRLAEIDKTQQALQAQNDQAVANVDLIKQNLLITDQKINKLAEGLQIIQSQSVDTDGSLSNVKNQLTQIHELNKHTDEKFAMLIDTTKSMLANANEVNRKVDQGRIEVNLTSEKITKLIEILKAIAEEQGKLEQIMASGDGGGGNKAVLKALDDLRRKANVNISRNDSILKKMTRSKR